MKIGKSVCLFLLFYCIAVMAVIEKPLSAKEVYTGTVVAIGGPSSGASRTFNITINDSTSDEDAKRFFEALLEEKQEGLMKAIQKENKGFFSIGGQVGRQLNVVRAGEVEGKRRIVIVFERWLKMAEVRAGSRSEDYPFGYIELFLDPNGKGEGTYIGAAKIRWVREKRTVEIENFGTYPAKLMGVMRHDK